MNITFIIGNGFDLACGLKTHYTDVYDKYCVTCSANDNIKNFKREILKDDYKNWTNFEMALPEWGVQLDDFEKFGECVQDFAAFLDDYLRDQELLINIEENKEKVAAKIKKDFYQIYEYCLQRSRQILTTLVRDSNESVSCRFITFNYTNTLERCLSTLQQSIPKGRFYTYSYSNPLHIHGTLQNGILLGLDNEEVYKSIPCDDIRKLKNLIDKLHINNRYSNVTQQALTLLKESRVIVIFGWSMGDSDSYWVGQIKEIFKKNTAVDLVYVPYYSKPVDVRFRNERLNREDTQKDFIAEKFDIQDNQRNRIHIVTGENYLNLEFLVNREETVNEPSPV